MSFASVPELLSELSAGRPIILLDNEDRENEGDFVVAADCVTCDIFWTFSVIGRGMICLVISEEIAERCHIPLMVPYSEMAPGRFTAFAVTVEAAQGTKTGIPFHERIHTIKTLISPSATPKDIVKPGHIQPLIARPGGVWVRDGHTESSSDLVRLSGFDSASSLIVEILKDDGHAAHSQDLLSLAETHHWKVGLVQDVFTHRVEKEVLIEAQETFVMHMPCGYITVQTVMDRYSGAISWICASAEYVSASEVSLDILVQPSFRSLDLASTASLLSSFQALVEDKNRLLFLLHIESASSMDARFQASIGLMFWAGLSVQLLRFLHIEKVHYTGDLFDALSHYASIHLC